MQFSCDFGNDNYSKGFLNNIAMDNYHNWPHWKIGKTGLSFSVDIKDERGEYPLRTPKDYMSVARWDRRDYTEQYTVKIFKSSETTDKTDMDETLLGYFKYDDFVMAEFRLASPIVLNLVSCQVPGISVRMGDDYELSEFGGPGSTPRKVKFNLALQCQGRINKVSYSFKATSREIDKRRGIVALNGDVKAAKGIALQLMNDAGQPIALDTQYLFNGFNRTDTRFNIPLSAAYYRLSGGAFEAGTANTSVIVTVSYL